MRFGAFPMPPICNGDTPVLRRRARERSGPRAGTSSGSTIRSTSNSIPAYSAGDVLTGRVGAEQLAGKDVLIGIASDVHRRSLFHSGIRPRYGVYHPRDRRGDAEAGRPVDLGWLPRLLWLARGWPLAATAQATAFAMLAILGRRRPCCSRCPICLEPQAHLRRYHARPVRTDDVGGRARLARFRSARPGQSGVEPAQPQRASRPTATAASRR